MILILGGAYQGKREFARKQFSLREEEFARPEGTELPVGKGCVYGLEGWVRSALRAGLDPVGMLQDRENALENTVLICQDIFCGVVPVDAEMRAWRQETGLVCQYLAEKSRQVWRVYCGLGQRLK